MFRVKSDKSDWLRVRKEFSAHVQKIGPGQRSRFLVLTKRSTASGDEIDPPFKSSYNLARVYSKYFSSQVESFLQNFKARGTVVQVKIVGNSSSIWTISPPSRDLMTKYLADNTDNVTMRFSYEFTRSGLH